MTDARRILEKGLAGRYLIERELGRGGMAVVLLARDEKHGRDVALKVLHSHLAATLGPERFNREIRLAAKLQHPHICAVLDSGETEGQLWFTMPFVEGETLRERLMRERQLPMAEAVRLTKEAAEALDYAHRHGVLHRDIKPENILLSEGHALVADFGVAKALGTSGPQPTGPSVAPALETLTGTGIAIGTPAYMSPEQAAGDRELDARTDVYALGSVLYEMLAGEPPFTGPTVESIISKRLATEPTPLAVVRPDLPKALSDVVARALRRIPAERFPSAAELGAALDHALRPSVAAAGPSREPWFKRAAPIFGLGLLVGLGALFAWRRNSGPVGAVADNEVRALAVLPFENLGGDEQEYFADGMTDEVRGKLAAIPGLRVIAGGSSSQYKKTTKTPKQVGQELGVRYLLVGKVRWEKRADGASRVRVSPELVDLEGGQPSTRWQQAFDAVLSDVFKVQGDIASQVAQALDLTLGSAQARQMTERPTANLAAYDAYLQGLSMAAYSATAPGVRRSQQAFERAVALDPEFFLAWVELGRVSAGAYYGTVPTTRDSALAKSAAERALALRPDEPLGHLAMGEYYSLVLSDFTKALEQYDLARRGAPQNADVLSQSMFAQFSAGRWEDALATGRQAIALDPRSDRISRRLASVLLRLRRNAESREESERGLALRRDAPNFIQGRMMVELALGDLEAARATARRYATDLDQSEWVAYLATYWDMYWVLDDQQQQLLLRLPPGPFGDDRGSWGLSQAQVYELRGDRVRARAYADSAALAFEGQLRSAPPNSIARASVLVYRAVALAIAGRGKDAVADAEAGAAIAPIERDSYTGPYLMHQLARVYVRADQPDKAVTILERLLTVPYYLTAAWIRIDPDWKTLKGNPRFEALIANH